MTNLADGDRDLLFAAYFRHMEVSAEDETCAWAWDAVGDVVRGPAGEAWDLVRVLLRHAPDDLLGTVAAGPLEDLVIGHGAELVDAIEAEAGGDERFRWALGCIWLQHGDLPADVMDRIVQASGGQIHPLPADPGDASMR